LLLFKLMMPMTIIGLLTLFLVLAGVMEKRRNALNIGKIPIRIHVNGTRGKSSVTRLIWAGLNEGGFKTYGKTSGSLPVRIFPDGSEKKIMRAGRPNIIEQCRAMDEAAQLGVDAIVLECMALAPVLQSFSELDIVKSTHGVITNVGPDHLDVMGPTENHVGRALCGTVPRNEVVYTGRTVYTGLIHAAARDRHSECVVVENWEDEPESNRILDGFSYLEHAENVSLALKVCSDLGVDRRIALEGMRRMRPDAGAMTASRIQYKGSRLTFVNAFGANDPRNTRRAWERAKVCFPRADYAVLLVNCRSDRILRNMQMGALCAELHDVDRCVIIGKGIRSFTLLHQRASGRPMAASGASIPDVAE
jgi:poly-gamma-glutamate synthase PgsB/CapB